MAGTREKIKVSPKVLKKLRESSGFSVEELADKLKVKPEKIIAVESGEDYFTVSQLERLAEIYKIPLVAFFTEEVIEAPKLPDYRINREKKLGHKTITAIRWARYVAETVHSLTGKESKLPKFGEMPASELAKKVREYLNIGKVKFEGPREAFEFYRNLIESKFEVGVLQYPLDEDVRAFSIKGPFSVIVLNESDTYSIKVFSLFHELCHLIKGEEGICSIDPDAETTDIERYCDEFAAEFLVPTERLRKEVRRNPSDSVVWKVAEKYGVSKQVIMIKLLKMGYIDRERYRKFKEGFKPEKKSGYGKADWTKRYSRRIGNLVLEEVNKAYHRGDITFFEAADILNVKTKHAEKLLG